MTNFWRISLALSLAANCAAVTAVGAHLSGVSQKAAATVKPPPPRLVEIRMLKRQNETLSSAPGHGSRNSSATKTSSSEPGHINRETSELTEFGKSASHSDKTVLGSSSRAIRVAVKTKLSGKRVVDLPVPKPGVFPAYNGILDLRNSKLKIVLHADPNKIPKNLLNKPNKMIGKSTIEFIGGKPKSTAVCVGSVGGRTVYASHLKILGAKNIEISGTKYCAPGGLPIPVNGGSSQSNGQNPGLKARAPGTGEAFVMDPHQAALNQKYGELSSGLANYAAEGAPPFQDGPVPGIAGEIRPPHLPDVDEDLNAPMKSSQPPSEEDPPKVDKGPFLSLGSLSESGDIPWGPMKKAPKYGLLADFYEGRNFEKYLFTRRTPHINYRWTGMKVDPQLPLAVPYSVRWSGFIRPRYSETYKLYTCSDDGVRLYIDGQLLIDNWTNHADSEDVCEVPMVAGHDYAIRVEYYEVNGLTGQVIRLYWESPSQEKEYVPEHCLIYAR